MQDSLDYSDYHADQGTFGAIQDVFGATSDSTSSTVADSIASV